MGEAAETVRRGLARVPGNPELLAIEGRILLQQGDMARARATLEKARRLAPDDPRVRVDLANLYRNAAELPAARAEAQQALRLAPDSAEARVAWGLVLGASGREAEAGESFRAALRLAPDQADALFYLASVELRAGRPAEAVPLLERLVARARPYPGAEEQLAVARAALPAPPAAGAVHLRLIRVRERAQADAASRRAAAGEDFAAIARGLSVDASAARGGDLGFVRPEDLAEPLRSAAAALAPGQVSAVLELPGGYALVKREK
jgi:parvulin-like peptidyl-prolyl isomerase